MAVIFLLQIEKQGLLGRVLLNGVPVRIWSDPGRADVGDPVNAWVRPGRNVLELQLNRAPENDLAAADPRLRLTLTRLDQPDSGPSSSRPLLTYVLPPEDGAPVTWPLRDGRSLTIDDAPPSDLWPRLAPVALDDAARAGVMALVDRLQAALNARDLNLLSRLLQYKAVDVARCFGYPTTQALPSQARFFGDLMQDPDWGMQPYGPDELQLHLVAGDTMVWVTRPGFAPALRSAPTADGLSLELPLYIAHIGGNWWVVR